MANKRSSIDREIDLHGFTAVECRSRLNSLWATREWQGLQRVRLIHGTGSVLHALVKLWCEEKGIAWTVEPHNPGVTIVHPGQQLQTLPPPPHHPLKTLHPLKKRTVSSSPQQKLSTDNQQKAEEENELSDFERMNQEFDRLGVSKSGSLLDRKNSEEPGDKVETERLQLVTPNLVAGDLEQKEQAKKSDPMEEEFMRLGDDDSLTLFKLKRDLLPARVAPDGAETIANERAGIRPRSQAARLDPMAQEFERLGLEPTQVTRKRKGGRDEQHENM